MLGQKLICLFKKNQQNTEFAKFPQIQMETRQVYEMNTSISPILEPPVENLVHSLTAWCTATPCCLERLAFQMDFRLIPSPSLSQCPWFTQTLEG